MPDDERVSDAPPDGVLGPSVARAAASLRAEVPLRAEWRERVLVGINRVAREERAASRAPSGGRGPKSRPRPPVRLVVAWPVAAAAAVLVFAAGAMSARMIGDPDPAAPSRAPAAASNAPARGTTRFVLVAPNAQRVALVGDFNLWDPASAPMHRMAGTDEWEIDLPLPAGRHVYAFVVDGDLTADPSAPRTAGDDFGRPNSVVLVSSPRS